MLDDDDEQLRASIRAKADADVAAFLSQGLDDESTGIPPPPVIKVSEVESSLKKPTLNPFGTTDSSTVPSTPGFVPPPPTTGACCTDTECTDETEAGCADLGGSFQGLGTSCASNPCPAKVRCATVTGAIDPCFSDPYHPGLPYVGCFKTFLCGDEAGEGDVYVDEVDCSGIGFTTESAYCCEGGGTGTGSCSWPGWGTPEYDGTNVLIPCAGDCVCEPEDNPFCQAFNTILETCSGTPWVHTELGGEVTVADLRSMVIAVLPSYPDWSAWMNVNPDETGITPGYCPVSDIFYSLGALTATGLSLSQTEYQFGFPASDSDRTLNWEIWYYPNEGDPTVTPMSEFISAFATESSVYTLDPPTVYGTNVIFNSSWS